MAHAHEGWFVNAPKRKVRFVVRRRRSRRRSARNPIGESLVVLGLGGNPKRSRRRRRATRRRRTMARRRMPAALARYWATHRRGRARPRRRRRRAVHENVYRPRRRRRRTYANRRRPHHRNVYRRRRAPSYRRRYRSNRARAIAGGGYALTRPQGWIVPVAAGGFGAASAAAGSRLILGPGATAPMSYLVEVGVGAAGWFILPMTGLVRRSTGFFFFMGSLIPIASDFVTRYLFRWVGLSAYAYETAAELAEMGQEPRFPPSLSAYNYELQELAEGDEEMQELGVVQDWRSAYAAHPYASAMPRAPWESGPGAA